MFIHWNLGRLKIHKSRIDGKLQCPPFIDDFPTKVNTCASHDIKLKPPCLDDFPMRCSIYKCPARRMRRCNHCSPMLKDRSIGSILLKKCLDGEKNSFFFNLNIFRCFFSLMKLMDLKFESFRWFQLDFSVFNRSTVGW